VTYVLCLTHCPDWLQANLLEAEKEGLAHPAAFAAAAAAATSATGGPKQPAPQPSGGGAAAAGAGGGTGRSTGGGYVLVEGGGDKTKEVESSDGAEEEEYGQEVVLLFPAPKQGRYDLQLQIMSDCWVGADLSVPVSQGDGWTGPGNRGGGGVGRGPLEHLVLLASPTRQLRGNGAE
jgi:hypothetical protein